MVASFNWVQGGGSGTWKIRRPPTLGALVNISTRVKVHPGEPTIIGFIANDRADFLLRVSGPALAQFGINDAWAAPRFSVHDGSGKLIRLWLPRTSAEITQALKTNTAGAPLTWDEFSVLTAVNSRAFKALGAFEFPKGSKDVSYVDTFSGAVTIVLETGDNDPGGTALVEVMQFAD